MRRLFIIALILLSGCSLLSDILVPDVPRDVAEAQDRANGIAFDLLGRLHMWVENPAIIPPDAAEITHSQIGEIVVDLEFVRDWMLRENMDDKVLQTAIDLLVAWQDYVDAEFCLEDAWLSNPTPMTTDTKSSWLQVFAKMSTLHSQLYIWMEHKGIEDA